MDSDVEDKITINKYFALKYEKKKETEELSKCKCPRAHNLSFTVATVNTVHDLHGDLDTGSESTDESEDEEGAWSAATEAQFLRTLSLLKNKDPIIYDKNATFYSTVDTEDPISSQGQRAKSMYLRDYERERLLTKGRY